MDGGATKRADEEETRVGGWGGALGDLVQEERNGRESEKKRRR